MLFSGVRSSCDMLARNSDLYFEVSASSVAFSSTARRARSISWFLRSTSTLRSASCCAFCSSCSFVCCSSTCCVCNSAASCCDCLSNPSVCIVASIELSTMPMPVVSCSRKVICNAVNGLMEASSMTALTWLSNKIGSTTMFLGGTLNKTDEIGMAVAGTSLISRRRLSAAHCPTRHSPQLKLLSSYADAGIRGQQLELRRVLGLHLIDHALLGVHQRGQFGEQQTADGRQIALALQHVGELSQVSLEPILLGVAVGGEPQVVDHRVDVVLELGHLTARLHLDRAGEIALGDGGRHLGDGTHLRRQIGGEQVDVAGQVLPGA